MRAPEPLRYSSERARQLAALRKPQKVSWTSEGSDVWLKKGQYDDLTSYLPPEDERREAEDSTQDDLGVVTTTAWDDEARQVRRRMTSKQGNASSSSIDMLATQTSLMAPPEETQLTKTVLPQRKRPTSPRAIFLAVDVTSSVSRQKRTREPSRTVRRSGGKH